MNRKPRKMQSFFVDEASMLIFALIYLDGELRQEVLGIREELYDSESKAKRWRSRLVGILHPDRCAHPQASEATAKLNSIYEEMVSHGR